MKEIHTCTLVLAVACALFLMEGCGKNDERVYSGAKAKDTIHAYEEYIKTYPQGKHVASARERIELLHLVGDFRSGIRDDDPAKRVETILRVQKTDRPSRLKELVPDLILCLSDKSEVTIDDAGSGPKVKAGHAAPGVPRELGLGGWVLPSGGSATGLGASGEKLMAFRFSSAGKESAIALSRITGQDFGEEQSKWEAWWKQQTGG